MHEHPHAFVNIGIRTYTVDMCAVVFMYKMYAHDVYVHMFCISLALYIYMYMSLHRTPCVMCTNVYSAR